jgi:carbonic anhydrase/acetyltransferase-like protein (isoleucine patch superfamily)
MPVAPFQDNMPEVAQSVFLAPDCWVIGKVSLGERVSIFFGAVLRGDIQRIVVGDGTNIQEHALVHTSHGLGDAIIGKDVTVGHRAIIHGATVGNRCIIGMGATLLDDAQIGEGSIIGAHTLIPKGVVIPPRSLVVGTPGKVVRQTTDEELADIVRSAASYQALGAYYAEHLSVSSSASSARS